jgi:hypothetical protein
LRNCSLRSPQREFRHGDGGILDRFARILRRLNASGKPLSFRSQEIDRINNLITNPLDLMHSNFACDLQVRT